MFQLYKIQLNHQYLMIYFEHILLLFCKSLVFALPAGLFRDARHLHGRFDRALPPVLTIIALGKRLVAEQLARGRAVVESPVV
jgi:hypothetical protein